MSKRSGKIIGCKYGTSPMVVTMGEQYKKNGKKPTVIMLHTYINQHPGTPDKNETKPFDLTVCN